MKRKIRYTVFIAVVCLIFLPSWASNPDYTPFSDKLASLHTKKADRVKSLSFHSKDLRDYATARNLQPQAHPISEPAMTFILGIVLLGLSAVGRKMIKY